MCTKVRGQFQARGVNSRRPPATYVWIGRYTVIYTYAYTPRASTPESLSQHQPRGIPESKKSERNRLARYVRNRRCVRLLLSLWSFRFFASITIWVFYQQKPHVSTMQRLVDNVIGITKESVKTFTYESLNNIVRLISGISALLLAILPGKTSVLEGLHGWELRPSFRGPRLPRWMENGVSSFNQFIHELSVDSDTSSSIGYSSGEEDNIHPASPSSQSSRISRASSFFKHDRRTSLVRCLFSWALFPAKFLLGIPIYLYGISDHRGSEAPSTAGNIQPSHVNSIKRPHTQKEHIVQRTIDRRSGIIEDLHLAIEISIEAIFDVVHKAAHCILSPSDTFRTLLGWFFSHSSVSEDISSSSANTSVPTAIIGENDPTPIERNTTFHQPLNTDGRTCRDVITEHGYPYEAIHVVTSDGYVLLLERIPRRDAQKVVYLQHGLLDSSKGWVSNGIVGSPAFAAFDQGFDVFLGNVRGLASREHVDKNISLQQYWHFSINEIATVDIPAIIEKIHELKISELKSSQSDSVEEMNSDQPYKLCTICHSLGGANILMYLITRRIEEKPHRFSRLILLSPAGFHDDSKFAFTVMEHLFIWLAPILAPIVPAFYVPTRFFRILLNKLSRDFQNYPAVGGLVQTLMSCAAGGDGSNWVGVVGYYNMDDMPGLSYHVALHLAQIKHCGKFIMFDYGTAEANMEAYGSPEPLDLGEYYGLIDVPVDLVGGRKDKVIQTSMIRKHYKLMKDSGVEVSYNEFEYAHLDFTFNHHEELLAYVMSRLLLVESTPNEQFGEKVARLEKKDA